LGLKTEYYPDRAHARAADHAAHFAHLAHKVLLERPATDEDVPPVLCAPFDAELFGHWWFEGPEFLKQVALQLSRPESKLALTTAGDYLDQFPPSGYVALPEGSWGRNGTHEVWLNPETE